MSCVQLYRGQDVFCEQNYKKYYQQLVLINKDDVFDFVISNNNTGTIRNRIRFSLQENKSGFLFRGDPNGIAFYGSFSKELDNNIPQYVHTVQLPIFGVKEETKNILKTLDLANYFAAIQFTDGTVEIFGFQNGLSTDDYTYDPQGNLGGSFITLMSKESGLEDDPPYQYINGSMTENEDFNNLFEGIDSVVGGDFNDDFNNDFFIED